MDGQTGKRIEGLIPARISGYAWLQTLIEHQEKQLYRVIWSPLVVTDELI